jgi:hypothetical protein
MDIEAELKALAVEQRAYAIRGVARDSATLNKTCRQKIRQCRCL